MSTKKPYPDLGAFFSTYRQKQGMTQPELARKLEVSQQTVSRWEAGASRPRSSEVPSISERLGCGSADLLEAAGYTSSSAGAAAPSLDSELPLRALAPQSFENFCTDLLQCIYRDRHGTANRYGGAGSDQKGIDIEVRGPFGVHSFQCKQVGRFGPEMVHAAVAKQTYVAERKYLLISNVATPKTRDAIALHASSNWELWDRIDISARFRSLSALDRRSLVDTYFRGQRMALLGEPESGPFLTPQQFFQPFLKPNQYFSHSWTLVGRQEQLVKIRQVLQEESTLVAVVLGAPGAGKSRLLRSLTDSLVTDRLDTSIWFVSADEEVKEHHLLDLGDGRKLIVVDDAHEREDLAILVRYITSSESQAKLLLALRPYGRGAVNRVTALQGMNAAQVQEFTLPPSTKESATELARQVLTDCGADTDMAEEIAALTYTTPLVTVLAAQMVAKGDVHPALIANEAEFTHHVLARLEDVLETDKLVSSKDAPKLRAVLKTLALLQPVGLEDPGLLDVLREEEGVEEEDALALMKLLTEAGILFKRGLRYRLAPDLLADSIIQRNFIKPSGMATSKVLSLFEKASAEHLKNLIVNLGRLDWRLKEGDTTGSVLLKGIEGRLNWGETYHHPHVEAVEAVAYYQPRLALDFASRLIEEKHGDDERVCSMIRNAAYNPDFLLRACELLWVAGHTDERDLNHHPHHALRLLKELAMPKPGKPMDYVDQVVSFAQDLLEQPSALKNAHTPFEIFEGALAADMEETIGSASGITIRFYELPLQHARATRKRVTATLLSALKNGSPRMAYLAARTLEEALRGPSRGTNNQADWDKEHETLLAQILEVMSSFDGSPVVVATVAKTVSWHALYADEGKRKEIARQIVELCSASLERRVHRLIQDEWGGDTWDMSEDEGEKAYHAYLEDALNRLKAFEADELIHFMTERLSELQVATNRGQSFAQSFIQKLIFRRIDFAQAILKYWDSPDTPLKSSMGAALSVVMASEDRRSLLQEILRKNSVDGLRLVAEAYARLDENQLTESDTLILEAIFESRDELTLWYAASLSRQIARNDPKAAVDLICRADLSVSERATRDFFRWLSHKEVIPPQFILKKHWEHLLRALQLQPRLSEHWVESFLRKAIRSQPDLVLDLVRHRLVEGKAYHDWRLSAGADRHRDGLGLLTLQDGERRLRELLDWAKLARTASGHHVRIGLAVRGLCGHYGKVVLDLMVDWMSGGTLDEVEVTASVLRHAHNNLASEEFLFVRKLLEQADLVSADAADTLVSALYASAQGGLRGGTIGEPFPEDLRMRESAKSILDSLPKRHPARKLYQWLLDNSIQNIKRQLREDESFEDD